MLLRRGTLDQATVVRAASLEEMTQSLGPDGEPSEHPSRYGLGVNVEQVDGHTCITHGGGMVGYASFVLADLDAGLGIAVLTNGPGEGGPAELIARTGYALVRAERDGSASPGVPVVDPWLVADAERYVGTYAGGGRTFAVGADGSRLTLTDAGVSGRLGWAGERLACTHPEWRTFHHELLGTGDDRVWVYGGTLLRPSGAAPLPEPPLPADQAPMLGHYRSYSPWYTNFRIVARNGALHLVAAGGVEGSRDDPLLVPLAPGVLRIGADPSLPERLVTGPVVGGRALFVVRDGCPYSRTFTD
jgi:D-alanyl-D-alanine carboxypeptidase